MYPLSLFGKIIAIILKKRNKNLDKVITNLKNVCNME